MPFQHETIKKKIFLSLFFLSTLCLNERRWFFNTLVGSFFCINWLCLLLDSSSIQFNLIQFNSSGDKRLNVRKVQQVLRQEPSRAKCTRECESVTFFISYLRSSLSQGLYQTPRPALATRSVSWRVLRKESNLEDTRNNKKKKDKKREREDIFFSSFY